MASFADAEDPIAVLKADPSESNKESQQQAIEDAGWQVQAVNWVYEKVTGENLIETLISPITGDFSKIETNAEAWGQVGDALRAIRQNLNQGISDLRESWDGAGAVAFETLLVATWTVALEGDAMLAKLIGKGFTKAAEMSRKMTDKALELIKKLVDRLIETAATGWIPVAGWANVVRNVEKCVEIVMSILELFEALKNMYDSVVSLVESVKNAGTNLAKIKDANSLGDVVNIGLQAKDDFTDVKEKATGVKDSATGVKDAATGVTTAVTGGSGDGSGGGGSGDGNGSGGTGSGGNGSGGGTGGTGTGGTGSDGNSGHQTLASGSL
ncbi:WXG100 family type VII secretion target [Saccharopolyspora sp. NPDC002376]